MTIERRKAQTCCLNGRDYDREVSVDICECNEEDFEWYDSLVVLVVSHGSKSVSLPNHGHAHWCHSHSPSLPPSLTHSLTLSPPHAITHSLARSLPHSLPPSLAHCSDYGYERLSLSGLCVRDPDVDLPDLCAAGQKNYTASFGYVLPSHLKPVLWLP